MVFECFLIYFLIFYSLSSRSLGKDSVRSLFSRSSDGRGFGRQVFLATFPKCTQLMSSLEEVVALPLLITGVYIKGRKNDLQGNVL